MTAPDVTVESTGHVAVVEIHRPPNNFFDTALIKGIADAYERLDDDVECRAIVLCAEGKHFCAGADFSRPAEDRVSPNELYAQAIRLFRTGKPVVAAVHGADPRLKADGVGLQQLPQVGQALPQIRGRIVGRNVAPECRRELLSLYPLARAQGQVGQDPLSLALVQTGDGLSLPPSLEHAEQAKLQRR